MIFRRRKYTGPERRKAPRWRPRPLRLLLALLLSGVLGYSAAVLWLITQETRLVFQAGRTLTAARPAFPYEQIDIPHEDGARAFGWVMRPHASDAGTWMLFLHGNAATIAARVNIAHYTELRQLGLNLLAPEYRGFASLEGVPTEQSLSEDARAAYDYLRTARRVAASRIVIYGWSLGSAVAVDLASKVDQAGVILEGAPASLVDIGQQRYPFFPIRLLMRNPFDSIRKVDRIRAPMLFIHSPDDTIIPIAEGRRLYDAAQTEKTFVEVRGGHIDATYEDTQRFYGAIRSFLAQQHLLDAGTDERPKP
jgi:fermentation-respiration switch protein FrsA (DUF1100 family)